MEERLFRIIFGIPSIIIAITVHEFFHAWTAFRCGDPTSKYENRVTLNPLAHFDPIGGGLLLLTLIVMPFTFGWGKPPNVKPEYMKNPRTDVVLVALAGPLASFALAGGSGFLLKAGIVGYGTLPGLFLSYFTMVNLGLGLFNLLPVPPLDGWKILQGILPYSLTRHMDAVERNDPRVLMVVLVIVAFAAGPLIQVPYNLLYSLFTGQ
ncbi:MAG: site-2 protease family protein [Candidatus Eremiobacteraeota bacterium]|nr:site-2 protease family protein [Candidatus Eremiobacteraeota bacterium]